MNIESVVVSWNPSKEIYTITMLTDKDGLVVQYAKDMHEAITTIQELETKYAA